MCAARIAVLGLCVCVCLSVCLFVLSACLSVCYRYSATPGYKAAKEQYQQPQCYVDIVFKKAFFLKLFSCEDRVFLLIAEMSTIFVCQRTIIHVLVLLHTILMRECIYFYALYTGAPTVLTFHSHRAPRVLHFSAFILLSGVLFWNILPLYLLAFHISLLSLWE